MKMNWDIDDAAKKANDNPEDHTVWYDLATLLDKEADLDAAAFYLKAIQLNPDALHYHSALILMWFDAGYSELAFESLEIAEDILRNCDDPNSWAELVPLYVDIFSSLLNNLDVENARKLFEKIPPKVINYHPELKICLKAYGEVHSDALEIQQNFVTDRPFTYCKKLPKLRLNQQRYVAQENA